MKEKSVFWRLFVGIYSYLSLFYTIDLYLLFFAEHKKLPPVAVGEAQLVTYSSGTVVYLI